MSNTYALELTEKNVRELHARCKVEKTPCEWFDKRTGVGSKYYDVFNFVVLKEPQNYEAVKGLLAQLPEPFHTKKGGTLADGFKTKSGKPWTNSEVVVDMLLQLGRATVLLKAKGPSMWTTLSDMARGQRVPHEIRFSPKSQ